MAQALNLLLDQPGVLFLVLMTGAAIGMGVEKFVASIERDRRKAYWAGRNGKRKSAKVAILPTSNPRQPLQNDKASAATDQLRVVMKADFKQRALLNRSEGQVFRSLDKIVIARNPQWQVMAQVSLGEFLWSEDKDAYGCINSKRVDFALMDADCRVRHTLEYQGNGHYQGTAAARDAVKKEALRKAGIGYHEIVAGHMTPADLKQLIEKLVPAPNEGGQAA